MANHFDLNRRVASAHVRAEQLKGLFIANAKLLLVLLSGSMLFFGVLLATTNIKLVWAWSTLQAIGAAFPIAIIAGGIAIVIEGGTLFSAAMWKERSTKIKQELALLDRVASKYSEDKLAQKKSEVKSQGRYVVLIMGICVLFSTCGAEIFWTLILQSQGLFLHIIGYILGITCSTLLIIFELNEDLVQRVIERSITSSALIHIAMDMSAKSQIHDTLAKRRSQKLKSPEFTAVLDRAAQQSLYGVLEESLRMAGASVSQEQLQNMIEDDQEAAAAADAFIASGGANPTPLITARRGRLHLPSGRRNSEARRAALSIISKYGANRVLDDVAKYASEAGISEKTLRKHAEDAAR